MNAENSSGRLKSLPDGYFTNRTYPVLFNHTLNNRSLGISLDTDTSAAYASRAYALTQEQDAIILPIRIRPYHPRIRSHYQRVGLNITNDIVWNDGHLPDRPVRPTHEYDVFIYDGSEDNIRAVKDTQRASTTMNLNDKNWFIRWCIRHGFPVPNTQFYEQGQIAQGADTFPVFVKAAVSASGQQVRRADSQKELREISAQMPGNYQVQDAVDAESFLNVQYVAPDHSPAAHLATTGQILHGVTHAGNIYPVTYDPRPITDPVAEEAERLGIRNIYAFDVAIDGGETMIIECNPRYNGATYPAIIARLLNLDPSQQWLSLKLNLPNAAIMDRLYFEDMEYDPASGTGMICTVWGVNKMLGVMVIGPEQTQKRIVTELKSQIKKREEF